MKKTLLFLALVAIVSSVSAQRIIETIDFETGYTDGESIIGVNFWQGWGDGMEFPAKNVEGGGSEESNWYARMEVTSTQVYGVVQRVHELTQGDTYSYKIWIKPDLAGQIGAYKLEVLDGNNAVVAGPVKGLGGEWQELSVSYIAAATQNYIFRLTKTWGNAGVSFGNVSLTCETCIPLAINTPSLDDKVIVSPNPATSVINITTDADVANVSLLSVSGNTVYRSVAVDQIDVSIYPKGLYILQITTAKGEVSNKKVLLK